MLEADGDRHVSGESGAQAGRLRLGDLAQRRAAADGVVALAQLSEELGRGRTPAADVRVVRLEVGRRRGRAVGHGDDAVHATASSACSWTSSTSRPGTSGGVSGSTPWPRLKTYPAAGASARTARASAAT